jgi:RNA-directed DNA polymerase
VVEGRGPAEGNAVSERAPDAEPGSGVSSELGRVRQVARKDKDVRFTALLHPVTVERPGDGVQGDSSRCRAGC